MSGYWAPKPLRPQSVSPLFDDSRDEGYVVKGMTDMQRQRTEDGTPHTTTGRTGIAPRGIALFVTPDAPQETVEKGQKLDPDEVIKAFLNS